LDNLNNNYKIGDELKLINAEGLVVGRLASNVAKQILNGEEVIIVNAEKALISGSRKAILTEYQGRRKLTHARKGPHYPRMPDRILKRTVRGMIPYQTPRGRTAYKNLKVYIGVPKEFEKKKFETIDNCKKVPARFMTLGDVSENLGARF
jgi:large subunit ribosomal protein L13